jgi:hypothetical protein
MIDMRPGMLTVIAVNSILRIKYAPEHMMGPGTVFSKADPDHYSSSHMAAG